jgi:hypothetical protein
MMTNAFQGRGLILIGYYCYFLSLTRLLPLRRLCYDYFVMILAVLIKYRGNQPFEGYSLLSTSVFRHSPLPGMLFSQSRVCRIPERLLRDSCFLVFLLYPVCAVRSAPFSSAVAAAHPFSLTIRA